MSRLIDADDLIKILEENNQSLEEQIKDARTEVQKVVYEAQLFTAKEIVEVIKEQPTAFDVFKVVGLLEKLKKRALNGYEIHRDMRGYIAYDKTIDIVKAGGIDE